ncbi:hypothetical protein [Niveispirillum sp.]|uniref:hypothetical protein n=1 Tax=Niveispirillum sp. TaxID=1917217 RepID=UPI001B5DC0F3|nr:hypothetical protein [Niveispirillum sp.]MBP7334880.1 hypothetical protein [Niveispirillum sp.]
MLIETADRYGKQDTHPATTRPPEEGVSADLLSLRAELAAGDMRLLGMQDLDMDSDLQVLSGKDALWVVLRSRGRAGAALRAAHCPGGIQRLSTRRTRDGWVIALSTLFGAQQTTVAVVCPTPLLLRVTTRLTPSLPLRPARSPRDLYLLGPGDDPMAAGGRVEAAQRGMNGGLCFFRLDNLGPGFGLYFQNLTALNDYFRQTGTKPDTVVGGHWPELGYRAPETRTGPLTTAVTLTLSDAFLGLDRNAGADEGDMALSFLRLLAATVRQLDGPPPTFRDWPSRARWTLDDLDQAPEATEMHFGHRYIRPYTNAEPPDSMVQNAVIAALDDYARWRGEAVPLRAELAAGLEQFHDKRLSMFRRYLPDVGQQKNADTVDSWYLYHPLLTLGQLAVAGDDQARRLFTRSLRYAIRAARHFGYRWPIHFDARDFSVVTATREDGYGQTDVGGLYACVMLLAHELTGDRCCLDEAAKAVDAARGLGFNLNYQANLTAWGAAACAGLWRATGRDDYLRQSYVYLASFLHNCCLWESEIGHARHYRNFLGVTALHNASYMAIYECSDSFRAFRQYLQDGNTALDPDARMLAAEFCRHALDRAWFYYPDALPTDALADKQRNGHIDRNRSFPLEDLYLDGRPAGEVGQEIYGAGAAFIFAAHAFHRLDDAPFTLFCDHFLSRLQSGEDHSVSFHLLGGQDRRALLRLISNDGRELPVITILAGDGTPVQPGNTGDGYSEFTIPACGRIAIAWATDTHPTEKEAAP